MSTIRRSVVAIIIVAAALLASVSSGVAMSEFSVRDSIAFARFSDPSTRDLSPAGVKYAPDGKSFVVVTTRGLLKSDLMESTIWLFGLPQARRFLYGTESAVPPAPRRLAAVSGKITHGQVDSYGSLISSLRWASDSQSVYFLGEKGGGRRLYRLNLGSGARAIAMTSADQDIETFDVRANTVVYTFKTKAKALGARLGAPINSAATDITGLDISKVLFPAGWGAEERTARVGLIQSTKLKILKRPQTNAPLEIGLSSTRVNPGISPNGKFAVMLLPAEKFPDEWAAFRAESPALKFKPHIAGSDFGSDFLWPSQYGLVDLSNETYSPLFDAPNAWVAGYSDKSAIIWSPDGTRVLLGSTFLPQSVSGQALHPDSVPPCALAIITISNRNATCLAGTRAHAGAPDSLYLSDAVFISSHKIRATFRMYNTVVVETYEDTSGIWLAVDRPDISKSRANVSATVRQDLNEPPALWISDIDGHARRLWNPAPEFNTKKLGPASVFKWRDENGFENTGLLIKPANYVKGNRYPLVIQTHGAHNEHEFVTDGAFTTAFAARELSSAGFVVLEVRDRHDNHVSGKEAPQMVAAFESAIDVLDRHGLVDTSRVGIIGFSRTCWYVESALVHAPSRYTAASITDGVDQSYLQFMLFNFDRNQAEGPRIYGGPPLGQGLRKWVEEAPGFHLDRVEAPLMIVGISAGSVLQEWETYSALRQQLKPVDFVFIPQGQHILQNPAERMASQQGDVDWFRFWLQGYEDQSPEKADQYLRWEGLCDQQIALNTGRPTFCIPTRH